MGCYSDSYKHMCSKIVIGVSCLMGLMGLLAIVFGVISMDKIPMTDAQKKVFDIQGLDQVGSMGKGAIAVGVVGMLVACLGCWTGKTKNFCFAIPYGLLSFVITIIFLVLALFAFAVNSEQGQTTIF
jgi:hypothetical protein